MDAGTALATGLLLGVSSGSYCFWSCAAVMTPYLGATADPPTSRWSSVPGIARSLVWYNAGRLVAYLLAALIVSVFVQYGGKLPLGAQVATRLGAAFLLALVLIRRRPADVACPGQAAGRKSVGALALGFTQGFAPCPPFLAAIGLALESSGRLSVVLLFVALYVGTALYTLPLLLLEPILRRPLWRRALWVVGLVVCAQLAASALLMLAGGARVV